MQDKCMKEERPRPKLFQWYKNIGKKTGIDWNIWVVKRGTVLWGFYVLEDGNCDITHTNLRYWDEQDPNEVFKDIIIEESDYPAVLKTKCIKYILKTTLDEDHDSDWFYG